MKDYLQQRATLYLTEEELSDILFHLPDSHRLRDYLQKAGRNIFNW